jgi:hypothetical protein
MKIQEQLEIREHDMPNTRSLLNECKIHPQCYGIYDFINGLSVTYNSRLAILLLRGY